MALKELRVRYASIRDRDYKLTDGAGLYLLVRPNGSKLWRFKYRFDSKEKLLSLGRYPGARLADARLRREEAKLALRRGGTQEQKLTPTKRSRSRRPPGPGMSSDLRRLILATPRACSRGSSVTRFRR